LWFSIIRSSPLIKAFDLKTDGLSADLFDDVNDLYDLPVVERPRGFDEDGLAIRRTPVERLE
jgi:hypothetical protein